MSYPTPGPNGPFGPPPGYGAPTGYAAPNFDPRMARAAQIAESARNWLIICAVGWFVGFMWITGPLAWYQSNKFRKEFESLGLAPTSDVNNLRLLGIITTIFVALGFVVLFFVVLAAVIGFAAWQPR
jgi:ABC-type multidrug transport system permease subunit